MKTSKYKFIIGGLLLLASSNGFKSYSQIPVTDVAANAAIGETNTALMESNMLSQKMALIQNKMKLFNENIEKQKAFSGWAQDLKTVKKLIKLIESTTCGMDKLSFLMKNTKKVNSCFFDFEYEIAMVKLTASAENLTMVMSSFSMEKNARMQLVNDAIKLLEEAQKMLGALTGNVAAEYYDQQYRSDLREVFVMSPYHKRK